MDQEEPAPGNAVGGIFSAPARKKCPARHKAPPSEAERISVLEKVLAEPARPEQDEDGCWILPPWAVGMPPGLLLRQLRLRLGVTQAVLAQRAGFPSGAVCRIEAGRASSWKTYQRYAAALGICMELRMRLPKPIEKMALENPGIGRWAKQDRTWNRAAIKAG